MANLELQHIEKAFGRVPVLKGASLRVADGEFVVLLGPSGCGKSTLLRIIAGLESQSGGSVLIEGAVVDQVSPRDRDIAMVFQQYALYPHLTVRDNLAFGLKMRKESAGVIATRIQEAADLLEIHALLDRRPKELSGGQRQRVAMGRAIVRKPKLFLFDEPLSNLDARLRTSMRVELKKLHERLGVTMIYVTHDQVEAMTLGQRIVIMDHGEIRQVGTPGQIYHKPDNPFVAGFIGNPPMNLIEGRVTVIQDKPVFQAGDFSLELPQGIFSGSDTVSHKAVWGIRPEDVNFDSGSTPKVMLEGTIDIVENLGADHILYLQVDDQRLISRVSTQKSWESGERATLHLPYSSMHLFIGHTRVEIAP